MPRIDVQPLTKEIAEKLGTIAWIEEADPVIAFRRMKEALAKEPFNCAVWMNADAHDAPGLRSDIRNWRETQNHRFLSSDYGAGAYHHFERPFTSKAGAARELTTQFNAAAAPCPGLQQHMQRRLEQLFDAFPDHKIRFQLRAGAGDVSTKKLAEHVDGGEKTRLRFLECLSGPGTLLFRNEDARIRPSRGDVDALTLRLPDEGIFKSYQAPPGSIVLISNDTLAWPALLHAEPVAAAGQAPERRTVTTYDCFK